MAVIFIFFIIFNQIRYHHVNSNCRNGYIDLKNIDSHFSVSDVTTHTFVKVKIWIYWSESNSWILEKLKNLLVRTKFYWSWAGGSVLIVITAHIEHVRQYTALKKCLYLTSPCSQNPTRDSLQNFHWTWTFGILNYDIFLKWI